MKIDWKDLSNKLLPIQPNPFRKKQMITKGLSTQWNTTMRICVKIWGKSLKQLPLILINISNKLEWRCFSNRPRLRKNVKSIKSKWKRFNYALINSITKTFGKIEIFKSKLIMCGMSSEIYAKILMILTRNIGKSQVDKKIVKKNNQRKIWAIHCFQNQEKEKKMNHQSSRVLWILINQFNMPAFYLKSKPLSKKLKISSTPFSEGVKE